MSRLVHLYPRAWREQYGEEFTALLSEQPLRVRDRLDIIRGALDAHHTRREETTSKHRPCRTKGAHAMILIKVASVGLSALLAAAGTLSGPPLHESLAPGSLLAGCSFTAFAADATTAPVMTASPAALYQDLGVTLFLPDGTTSMSPSRAEAVALRHEVPHSTAGETLLASVAVAQDHTTMRRANGHLAWVVFTQSPRSRVERYAVTLVDALTGKLLARGSGMSTSST